MSLLIAAILFVALVVFSIPTLVLFVQVIVAVPVLRPGTPQTGKRPRISVLVPAHNEEAGITGTIHSVLTQLWAGDRLLVVADNCSDNTADVAMLAGAQAEIRTDLDRRGKGYALDFGVCCLAENPPEILIIVDADCIVSAGTIDYLARTCLQSGRPVQSLYLMNAPADSGPMKKVAEFAWVVKNLVRPLGFHRLGLPCQLMGTGMAFPWATIRSASLANGHIVEDMKLGIDMALGGKPPLFCPHALVSSTFPTSAAGTKSQRTRWEHGHVSMILSEAPKLLREGIRRKKLDVIALALDLSVPPVALLTLLVFTLFACALALWLLTGVTAPLLLATGVLGALGISILLAWWRYGRPILNASNLGVALIYALAKVPLYLRFFVNRQVEWVRSKRDTEN
jgi:cellulose synthase/poly-beta-1,6-N-acetylglucosamine synthase-like glycosyltransferase